MRTRSAFNRFLQVMIGAAAGLTLAACGMTPDMPEAEASAIPISTLLGGTAASSGAQRAAEKPSGIPATQGVIVQAGDSIGVGLGADNWAAIEHLGLPPGVAIHNVSVSGQWMLTGLGEREKDLYPFYDPKHTSVLMIQQGSNDLLGGNSAPYLYENILRPFVRLSKAAGFYVAVGTILPRTDPGWVADPNHEEQRKEYNKLVRANSVGADTVIDLAADPEIGDPSDPSTSPHYADGAHPRKSGQERIAKMYAKPLARLLQEPPRTPVGAAAN